MGMCFLAGTEEPSQSTEIRERAKQGNTTLKGGTLKSEYVDLPRHLPMGVTSHGTPPASSNGLQGLRAKSGISKEAKHNTLSSVAWEGCQ